MRSLFRILLVDDELFFRQGLREIIDWDACGYEVIGEQDNGEDAFHYILEHRPDVVITDIRMPVCDGLELIHKVVHEAKLKTKFIIVSGYDEFKYAQQAIKYGVCDFLLKPIDEQILEHALRDIASKLRNEQKQSRNSIAHHNVEVLDQIVHGQNTDIELKRYYDSLRLQITERYYFVFIEYNEYPNIKKRDIQHIDQVHNFLLLIKELIPEIDSYHLYPYQGKLGLLINQSWLKPNTSLGILVKQLRRTLSLQLDSVILIYFSDACSGLHFLREAYQKVEYVQQFKYFDERQLFDYNDFAALTVRDVMLPADYYKPILQVMEDNHEKGIKREIDQLFQKFQEQHCSTEAVKASLHKLVADCLQILQEMQVDKNKITGLQDVLGWAQYHIELASLKQLFIKFIIECSSSIAMERKEMAKGGIQRIKKYIDQHYANQISLKSIAAQFYINPVYLGQLFKKNYDLYFNDYLLQLRIFEAKKLLRQTDMRIYEVAEKVGFNHSEYFVAQFEKMEKLSPTAYRQTFKSLVGD